MLEKKGNFFISLLLARNTFLTTLKYKQNCNETINISNSVIASAVGWVIFNMCFNLKIYGEGHCEN